MVAPRRQSVRQVRSRTWIVAVERHCRQPTNVEPCGSGRISGGTLAHSVPDTPQTCMNSLAKLTRGGPGVPREKQQQHQGERRWYLSNSKTYTLT